jgi:hypothetical protein
VADTIDEYKRRRLLAIRKEFRRLMDMDAGRPLRNKAVFHSGTAASVPAFCHWLGTRNSAFAGAVNLESLPAGAYLQRTNPELVRIFGTSDFDQIRTFQLPDGSSFSGSINGMWRELSARYARACSGIVHVLVSHDRTLLHRASLTYWANRPAHSVLPKDLKVFGFVEFPILAGMLASNSGVIGILLYTEATPGKFLQLSDSPIVIGTRAGNA